MAVFHYFRGGEAENLPSTTFLSDSKEDFLINDPGSGMAASSFHGSSATSSPCAACKFLRRKCTSEYAPYFPPDQPQKFSNVHKIFGASNVTKILSNLPSESRQDTVNSLAFEADARMKDSVYGCVGAISRSQRKISVLKTEIEIFQERIQKLKAKDIKVPSSESLGLPSESVSLGPEGDQGGPGMVPERDS